MGKRSIFTASRSISLTAEVYSSPTLLGFEMDSSCRELTRKPRRFFEKKQIPQSQMTHQPQLTQE